MKTKFLLILFYISTSIQIQAGGLNKKVSNYKKQQSTDEEIIHNPHLHGLNVDFCWNPCADLNGQSAAKKAIKIRDLTKGDVKPISLFSAIELVILSYPDKFGVDFGQFWNPSAIIKHHYWSSSADAHARWYIQHEELSAREAVHRVIQKYFY